MTTKDDNTLKDGELDQIKVVPNPYIVTSVYERVSYSKEIHFTHLPQECVIRIYNTSGDMIQILQIDFCDLHMIIIMSPC